MADLVWTDDAVADVDRIATYIAQDSPAYAEAFVLRLHTIVDRLAEFPMMGRRIPEFDTPELREIIIQNYRVPYRAASGTVEILAVVHAAMDIEAHPRSDEWFYG
jgi:plasmid stabilization system protein ParE